MYKNCKKERLYRMKYLRFLLVAMVLLFAAQVVSAAEVSLSGFAEARGTLTLAETNQLGAGIESTRVRFDTKLTDWLSANVEFGSSGDTSGGTTSTAVTMRKAIAALTSKLNDDTTLRVEIGQRPVPMGIASGWYTAPANAFLYAPIVSSTNVMGTWSDIGVFGTLSQKAFSLTAYVVQGAGTTVISTDVVGSTGANAPAGIAGGLRAVVTPVENLNLGLSYAISGRNIDQNYSIMAGDVVFSPGPVVLTFQYLAAMPKFEFDSRADAWFAQFEFKLEEILGVPITPGVRYDYLTSNARGTDEGASAITIQAMYQFEKALRIGLSFRTEKDKDNLLALQVLTMF
jgi:hypothetical protein